MRSKFLMLLKPLFVILLIDNQVFADFSLVCPPDVTVSCRDDYFHDLNAYGRAYTDYNGVIQYQHDCKTIIDIDDCGKGTIKRVWSAENPENWKWFTCTQIITISNLKGFTYSDVTWPPSIEILSCNPQSDIKNLQAPYDAPSWERPKCAKPMVSYKDTRFRVNEGCEKIIREWKILDWCQYDPINYPGRGFFSYTQVIKLISTSDTIALHCKKDTVVLNNRNCDSIYVQLDSAIFQSGCKIYHSIYNTSKYAIHSGANASGYYPNGISKFYYIAEYACGKEIKCEVTLDIRNVIPPTPYCLTGVILTLMPVDQNQDGIPEDGMITVWASDLDKGSWHKCPKERLTFSFSKDKNDKSRTYTCKEIGENQVEIWVTDTLGNQDVCKTIIEIQNNNPKIPNCGGNIKGGKKTIKGEVVFFNTLPPSKASASLITGAEKTDIDLCKRCGYKYEFKDIVSSQDYLIEINCNQFDPDLIDYNDVLFLKNILSGKEKFASSYAYFAADINGDHKINTDDYKLLKQVVVNKRYPLMPKFWQIIPTSFSFQHQDNPLIDNMPQGIFINHPEHNMEQQNFIAIRIGDLVPNVDKDSNIEFRNRILEEESDLEIIFTRTIPNGLHNYNLEWSINSEKKQVIELQVFSIDGKNILSRKIALEKGFQNINVNIEASGLILYQFENEQLPVSGKIFLQY